MSRCRRNILIVFICAVVLAGSFLPCAKVYRGQRKDAFVFTPYYLHKIDKLKDLNQEYRRLIKQGDNTREVVSQIANLEKYRFKLKFFLRELIVIFVSANFIYILLCIVFAKKWKGPLTKAQELTLFGWLFLSPVWLLIEGISRRNIVFFIMAQAIFFIAASIVIGIDIIRKKFR